ncbi:MAG: hypothetical protein KAR20_17620 [Candidatus Heimdallarchaeota archaeon]|nr:hypothetical protein [Candidatus Heimdallarchaeota archaeon]
MLVKRSSSDYMLDSFDVSFSDIQEKNYNLRYNVISDSQLYKFYAEVNPQTIYISLNVLGNFSKPICKRPRELDVRYCLTKSPGWGKGSLNGSEVEDYILLDDPERKDYPKASNLSEKETAWKVLCESEWECSEWESCEERLQRRNCEDKNQCFIPTYLPETVRPCDLKCIESWDCDWSDCIEGFTTPTCEDRNNCNSSYLLPPKVSCSPETECRPFIQCDEWSSCEINYDLIDLNEQIDYTKGTKSRICRDLNFCVESIKQVENCSRGMDIYTRRFTKCGIKFIGIYNKLNDKLIARIDEGAENESILNIHLDGSENNLYCDHCFNGIKDGNEENIDCGGSCEDCSNKYLKTTFRKKTWWDNLYDWIKELWT